MKLFRRIASVPFLLLALGAWLCEMPFNAFGVFCVRTVGYVANMPAVDRMLSRMFLISAVRCPRCGRSDVTTIIDD